MFILPIGYKPLPGTMVVKHRNIMLRVTRVTEYFLRKTGYVVSRLAKESMPDTRDPKAHARPGEAPFAHTTSRSPRLLKRMIGYAFIPGKNAVIIGPEKTYGEGQGTAPKALEHGGSVVVPTGQRWITKNGKPRRVTTMGPTNLLARPYMGPALDRAKPQLTAFWRQAVTA
jgi:hypothetical protein